MMELKDGKIRLEFGKIGVIVWSAIFFVLGALAGHYLWP